MGFLARTTKSSISSHHVRRLATVQPSTPRQMPVNGKKRNRDVSSEISNLTIRVREGNLPL
jgi:hypothetical protein